MKCISFLVLLIIIGITGFMNGVHGAGGECDKYFKSDFEKLAPCVKAAQDIEARVSHKCCVQMRKMDVKCLCVAVLSEEFKKLGVVPAAAVTIPKRGKIANRPKGYKCGDDIVP